MVGVVNATVIALAKACTPYDVIAAETGMSRGMVAMLIYRARKSGENIPYWSKPRAKINRCLSTEQVEEIYTRAKRGERGKVIADAMALPLSTVTGRMMMMRGEGRLEYRNNMGGR